MRTSFVTWPPKWIGKCTGLIVIDPLVAWVEELRCVGYMAPSVVTTMESICLRSRCDLSKVLCKNPREAHAK